MIEDLCKDKDPLLRRCGMFTIAMAYCGSGNNKAIRKLLHVAVSQAVHKQQCLQARNTGTLVTCNVHRLHNNYLKSTFFMLCPTSGQ